MQIPRRVSLRSINFRDRFLRHKNFLAEVEPIVSELDKADATFIMTVGNNGMGSNSVSFASVNFPGFWLRNLNRDPATGKTLPNFRLILDKEPVVVDIFGPHPPPRDAHGSHGPIGPEIEQFRQDSTFLMGAFDLDIPSLGGTLLNGITNSNKFSTAGVFFVPQIGRSVPLPMRHRDFHVFMEVTDRAQVHDQQWEIVDGLLPKPPTEPH
jgi:Alpha-L-arabinofuranosidase B (ABFB) domain